MMRTIFTLGILAVAAQCYFKRDTAVLQRQFGGLKPNCKAVSSGGCKCEVDFGHGVEEKNFYNDVDCKIPLELQTANNKKALNAEIKQKFGAFKENCFPKPSGGCKCNVDYGHGEEVVSFNTDAECKISLEAQTINNKKEVNAEIKGKFGSFKENCFPKPSGGCKCNEKDVNGNEMVATYQTDEQCKVRNKRDVASDTRYQQQVNQRSRQQPKPQDRPSQNVRDPVREKAQANYRAVVNELNEKFKGLKEGCFPRPKGCLCVVGKTAEGREVTERRMKDADCKCKVGEKGPGCPAA